MTFEESWPDVSKRLRRFLAARRVPASQRDDILQETAIRLFRAWERVDLEQGAWALARTIANHAISDGSIATSRCEARELPEMPDPVDPERVGLARFRLSSVRRGLLELTPTDRRVLLAEIGEASPPALGPSALRMARSRARLRLREIVEKPGSWLAVPRLIRSPLEHLRRVVDVRAPAFIQFADSATATLIAIVASVAILNLSSDPDGFSPSKGEVVGAPAASQPAVGHQRAPSKAVHPVDGGSHVVEDPGSPPGDQHHELPAEADAFRGEAHFIREGAEREAQTINDQAGFIKGSAEREAQTLWGEANFIKRCVESEVKNLTGEQVRPCA